MVVAGANVHDTKPLELILKCMVWSILTVVASDNGEATRHMCPDRGYDNQTGHLAVQPKATGDTSGAKGRRILMPQAANAIRRGAG